MIFYNRVCGIATSDNQCLAEGRKSRKENIRVVLEAAGQTTKATESYNTHFHSFEW